MPGTEPTRPIPLVLGEIYLRSRTGVLQLEREGERLGLAFRNGRLVRAEGVLGNGPQPWPAPPEDDDLARHLTRVLVELRIERGGNAKPKTYTREPLLAALGRGDGGAAFAEEEVEDRAEPAEATTEELVLEAVRSLDADAVHVGLGDLDRPLALALNPDFNRELSPTDAYILSRVDGKMSANEILQLVPQSTEETERSLLGLLLTGVVEFLDAPPKAPPHAPAVPVPPTPAPLPLAASATPEVDAEARLRVEPRRREVLEAAERLQTLSHFEILGVSEGASEQEIKQGYFRQAKKFHPDQFHDPGFADIADKIEAVFMRVDGAYEVLRDPESRQSYEAVLRRRRSADRPVSRPLQTPVASAPSGPAAVDPSSYDPIDSAENAWMAEEAIHRAERLITELRAWDAIQLLQAVIPRIYGKKQRERARVLLAKAYIKNPNWLRRGEELLQQVLQDDPQNAEAHFALGMLYKESGMSSRAVTMFKKTLELRPDHRTAQTELNSLSGPAFLRKLFGKG